jgi:hypothetical protein
MINKPKKGIEGALIAEILIEDGSVRSLIAD